MPRPLHRTTLLALPALALILSGARAFAAQDPAAAINDVCPVMPEEGVLEDMDIFVEYEGLTVALCCKRCKKEWLKDPEPFVAWLGENGYLPASVEGSAATSQEDEPAVPDSPSEPGRAPAPDDPAPDAGAAGASEAKPADAGEGPVSSEAPAPRESALRTLVDRAGRFHPLVVHFPVALLVGALLAHGLGALRGAARYEGAARFCLAFGAVGAVVAAALGWASAAASGYPPSAQQDLFLHRWVGTVTAVLAVFAWCTVDRRGRWHRALLVAAALGVAVAGHFGGNLIYGPNHLFGP